MKLIGSLAAATVVAARRNRASSNSWTVLANTNHLYDGIIELVNEHFTQDYDGFTIDLSPYFHGEVSNYGMQSSVRFSTSGRNPTTVNYYINNPSSNEFSLSLEVEGRVGDGLGYFIPPSQRNVDEYEYNLELSAMASLSGFSLKSSSDYACNFVPNSQWNSEIQENGHISHDLSIDVSFDLDRDSLSLTLDTEGQTDASQHFRSFFENRPVMPFGLVESTTVFDINSLTACKKWFTENWFENDPTSSCVVEVQHQHETGPDALNMVKGECCPINLSLAMRPYAIVGKLNAANIGNHLVFIRGEDKNGRTERLSRRNYRGLYYTKLNNWQTAINNNDYTMLLLVPGLKTIKNELIPALIQKIEPWNTIVVRCKANPKNQLYLYYNIDRFLQTINSDEFDFSDIILASRINSDALKTLLDKVIIIPAADINTALAQGSQQLNRFILDNIHRPEIQQVMDEIRAIVEDVSGPTGQRQYETMFAALF